MENQATTLSDDDLVRRILAGEHDLYEVIIRRYDRRLYRVVRSAVQDEDEAEDIVQDAYARAFEHLAQFQGRAPFSTWLTKIAVHEASSRMKQRSRHQEIDSILAKPPEAGGMPQTPEQERLAEETRTILEDAIDRLPDAYRSVFVMRSLEGMNTLETAQCLDISEDAVKIRLFRARRMLRRALYEKLRAAGVSAFQFLGERCDSITVNVLTRIASRSPHSGKTQTFNSSILPN